MSLRPGSWLTTKKRKKALDQESNFTIFHFTPGDTRTYALHPVSHKNERNAMVFHVTYVSGCMRCLEEFLGVTAVAET